MEELRTLDRNTGQFPEFDDALRAALESETARFVSHVVFEGGGFPELLRARYTFVNEALGRLYGIPAAGVTGFEKRDYPAGRRAGILGHGSVLAVTSHSDQTSPVRRGLFVRRRLLCQDLPPPPPDIPGVPEVDPTATTRERFRMHSDDPACRSCHQYTDALGFGLETFDPIGRWRDTENGAPIDPSGELNDVNGLGTDTRTTFQTLPELADALAESEAARSCFVRQTYRWARGFRETLANRCARLWIERRFAESGGDIKELLVAIVLSPDFVVRK